MKVDLNSGGLMIRIVEEQYLNSTLEGKFWFGSLALYANIEELGNKTIGDENEGTLFSSTRMTNFTLVSKEKGVSYTFPGEVNVTQKYGLSEECKKKVGIACFTYLNFSEDYIEESSENNCVKLRMKDSTYKDLQKFMKDKQQQTNQKCKIILFEKDKFFDALSTKDELDWEFVKYYYPNDDTIYKHQKDKPYYFKTINYKKQREFRIIAPLSDNREKGEVKVLKDLGKTGGEVDLHDLRLLISDN